MTTEDAIFVIIVAAGTGSRFGADLPKQFCLLEGKPVLCHTIERLREALPQAYFITVVSESMIEFWLQLAAEHGTPTGMVVTGGNTRWQSVKNALCAIPAHSRSARVLVHDGARPLVDDTTVGRVVDAIAPGVSVVPVNQVTDSLRMLVDEKENSLPVNRTDYRAVVTPQGFMLDDLLEAYAQSYKPDFTDDASVMASAGFTEARLVDSFPSNIKITNPGDLALAAWYLSHQL